MLPVQDPVLDATVRELKKAFPKVQLRKVPLRRWVVALFAKVYVMARCSQRCMATLNSVNIALKL